MTQLPKLNIAPNQFVFSSSVVACSKLDSVVLGEQVHAQVVVSGFESDPFVCTSLIDLYSKVGCVDSAVSVFRQCSVGDSPLFNSMVSCYVSSGDCEGALGLFAKARRCSDFKPTEYSFGSLIKACSDLDKETGQQLHGFVVKTGLESNCVVGTSLVDMYGEFGDVNGMEMVFDGISFVDTAVYNAMSVACLKNNALEETALDYFRRLMWEGLSPNECTFSSVLKACSGLKSCNLGVMIHGLVMKSTFRRDLVVNTALTDMYMKCGNVEEGCKVFDGMPERGTVSYNSMISGHGRRGNFDEAINLFIEMKRLRKSVDLSTFIALLSSCPGREWPVYVHAIKHGFRLNSMVQNALLDGLLKKGSAEEALELFDKIKERNVVSWTTIISGLTQLDQHLEAIKLFKAMNSTETTPNSFTFSSVLKACGILASLDQGRCIHASIEKSGIMDEYVKSSVLDMYSKCGALADSRRLFDGLASKDIVSWNTMITAYAKHGHGLEAISLYKMMTMHNIDPNHVTFVSLLSGCSHCGLIEEGIDLFEVMVAKHGIEHLMEHYACMVDLFGRAGMLGRARDCISDMPFEADASVWAVLLAACKLHGNVEMGQMAKDRIMGMKGQDNPSVVIMSNMYSEVGKWDYAEKSRRRIGVGGAGKQPGFSWV